MVLDIDIGDEIIDDEAETSPPTPAPKKSSELEVEAVDTSEEANGDQASQVGYGTNDNRFGTTPSSSSSTFGGGSTAFTNTMSSTSFGGFEGSVADTQSSSSETNKGSRSSSASANGSEQGSLPTPATTNGSGQQDADFKSMCTNLIKEQLRQKTPQSLEPVVQSICDGLLGEQDQNSQQWKNLKHRLTQIFQNTWCSESSGNGSSENKNVSKSIKRQQAKAARKQSPYQKHNTWVPVPGMSNFDTYNNKNATLPDARSIICNRLLNRVQENVNQMQTVTIPSLMPAAQQKVRQFINDRVLETVSQIQSSTILPLQEFESDGDQETVDQIQSTTQPLQIPAAEQFPNSTGTILTREQLDNPLTTVVTHSKYPEHFLKHEQFELFKSAVKEEIGKTPVNEWPKFETSFFKGGVFVFIAAEQAAQDWLRSRIDDLKPWDGADLKVYDPSILVQMIKVQTSIMDHIEKPSEVIERLQLYNPSLNTKTWIITNQQETKGSLMLDFFLPESEVKTLESLNFKPFYDLGRLTFQRADPQTCVME